jgi:medium-chain acyl-[acyl-carrier-protein] hydrolase
MGEAPMSDLGELVRQISAVISSQPRMPFAFFGHSLGGLLAFEVARYCMLHYLPQPLHLFASGCSAPQYRDRDRKLHLLPDNELIEALKDYNGTPAEVLANEELMSLLLPMLRADFALVENYQYRATLRLSLPISVLAGRGDSHVEQMQVDGWSKETSGSCRVNWFEGDHFFVQSERAAVLDLVRGTLAEPVCA